MSEPQTPEERANQVWRECSYDDYGKNDPDEMKGLIADAIREAVAAEREACAKMVSDARNHALAARIRARSTAS